MTNNTTATSKLVTVNVLNTSLRGSETPPDSLSAAIDWLSAKLHSIPEQYRASATFEICAETDEFDSAWCHIVVGYSRPETRRETDARIAAEAKSEAEWRERELEALRHLKAKYPEAA